MGINLQHLWVKFCILNKLMLQFWLQKVVTALIWLQAPVHLTKESISDVYCMKDSDKRRLMQILQ